MITPERGGLSSEGTGQLDDQGNRATEETGNDRPAAPVSECNCPARTCQPEDNVGRFCWRTGYPIYARDFAHE
jgi:hypothetical protein